MSKEPEKKVEKGGSQLSGDIGKKYKLMVQILTSDPRYGKALAEVTSPSLHDKLSQALINISFDIGASLVIIRSLIHLEFERKYQHPTTILRVNSIVSKMTGKYTKKVGDDYLKKVLGEYIVDLHNKPDLKLEPNSNYLKGDNVQQQSEENLQKLQDYCQKFLDRIVDEAIVEDMPRELRAICYFIESSGEQFKLNKEQTIYPLISGFVMLRYICPAITLPHLSGILTKLPDGDIRNNLTYIAKVLQKLANQEKFEVETPHLMPLNRFIERNKGTLIKYLKSLPVDPKKQEGKSPFGDLMKKVSYEDIHLKTFNVDDLKFLHGLIYDFGYELISSLQTEVILTDNKRPFSIVSMETDFLTLVHDLGPPDGRKVEPKPEEKKDLQKSGSVLGNKGGETKPGEGQVKQKETFVNKTQEQIESTILTKTLDVLMNNIKSFNLTELEQSRFFYLGKPTKNNVPVFYLILHRIEKKFLENNDAMMVFVYKTLWKQINEPYVLVIDLSWAKLNDDFQSALYRSTVSFTRLMKKEHLLNCAQIHLLHPTFKTLEAIEEIFNLLDDQTRSKLVKNAYEWTELQDSIEISKIWIPFVSKKFVPITHNLTLVNYKEKKFERLVKITHDSILNIDIRNGTVHGEIPLSGIQEIKSRLDANEIIIKYTPLKEQEQDPYDLVSRPKGQKEDLEDGPNQTIRYICAAESQRDIIVESLFDSGIRSVSLIHPQGFKVNKEAEGGKKHPRTLKLTSDSILNFADKVIKREIPYSTIQSFYVDQDAKNKMYINFMSQGQKRSYVFIADDVHKLRDSLLDAIVRFKFYVQTEMDLFKKTKVDAAVDKFFGSTGNQELFDQKKWKALIRIDGPTKDLKVFYKKLNPDGNDRAPFTSNDIKNLNLGLSDDEIKQLIEIFDPKARGFILFDDLVAQWIFLKKEKTMIDKKKQALQQQKQQAQKKE